MMQLLSWQMFWKSKRPYSMMISPVSFLYYTEALKSVRAALGLSQKAFAERIGIVPSYYYKIEEGNRRPSRKVYQKIYAAIETTSLQTSLLGEHPLQ